MRRNALSTSLFAAIATLSACGDDGTATTDTPGGDTSTTTDASTTSPDPTTGVPTTTDPTTTTTTDTTTDTTAVTVTETTTDTTTTTTDTTTGTTTDTTTDTTTGTTTDTGTDTDTDTDTDTTTAGDLCGNGVLDDGETCDGAELAGQDCTTQSFDSGTLACAADCLSFDVAACVLFSCGNEIIEGEEQCDGTQLGDADCVSEGFAGGTLACAPESCVFDTTACFKCGDNAIQGDEVCDGTALADQTCVSQGFDEGTLGCAADCSAFNTSACATCGDGVLGGAEQCDGAALGGATCLSAGADYGTLGCTAECGFDLTNCVDVPNESEPNDDENVAIATNDFLLENAEGPYTSNILIGAKIDPVGDDDFFAVQNTGNSYALLRLETFGAGGPGTCATIDTMVEVRSATNTLLGSNDDDGVNACSLLTNFPLAPGETVYVRVIEFGDNAAIGSYFLDIQLVPVVCGDGAPGPGELCDDSNVNDGDGCSASCQVEGWTAEIEPNNTNIEADATGLVGTGNNKWTGSITPIGDLDRYRYDLAAPQVLRLETFTSLNDCAGANLNLRLFDTANTQVVADTENIGIANCSAVLYSLPAGTFYAQVGETNNDASVPGYLLESVVLANTGPEIEPNETLAAANLNIQNGSDVVVFGDHSMNADSDYYRIDVPVAGSSLRLEIIEGDPAVKKCNSNQVDSRITLYNAQGTQLVDDDDGGRGYCSLIDGTGTVPKNTAAHNLAAGTYYVQVRASTLAQAPDVDGQFTYHLVSTIRTP